MKNFLDSQKHIVKYVIFASITVTSAISFSLIIDCVCGIDDIRRHSVVEFIREHGYPAETHYVTTTDGYILNIHRIPHSKTNNRNGKVIYLAHGLWVSSMIWLFSGPESSLAFQLADEGYDVWLVNFRGSEYSRKHRELNSDTDSKFWNFTFHEMGIYDLPVSINYILHQTNCSDLFYVGISQGATAMYALTSTRPEFNKKIRAYVHLGPTVFIPNTKSSFLTVLVHFYKFLKEFISLTGGTNVFSPNSSTTRMLIKLCNSNIGKSFFEYMNQIVCGYSSNETNSTLIPLGITHVLSGGSSKELLHFLQEAISGHFSQFDYGKNGNLLEYGQNSSPDYDLSKVTTPGYLFYGGKDNLVDHSSDLHRLSRALGNCSGLHFMPSFNHIDFIVSVNAPKLVYSKILQILAKY